MASTTKRMHGDVELTTPTDPAKRQKLMDWIDKDWRNAPELLRPLRPGDAQHQREEPDDTNAYNKGGMVKHGSSTRVSCKSK